MTPDNREVGGSIPLISTRVKKAGIAAGLFSANQRRFRNSEYRSVCRAKQCSRPEGNATAFAVALMVSAHKLGCHHIASHLQLRCGAALDCVPDGISSQSQFLRVCRDIDLDIGSLCQLRDVPRRQAGISQQRERTDASFAELIQVSSLKPIVVHQPDMFKRQTAEQGGDLLRYIRSFVGKPAATQCEGSQ